MWNLKRESFVISISTAMSGGNDVFPARETRFLALDFAFPATEKRFAGPLGMINRSS